MHPLHQSPITYYKMFFWATLPKPKVQGTDFLFHEAQSMNDFTNPWNVFYFLWWWFCLVTYFPTPWPPLHPTQAQPGTEVLAAPGTSVSLKEEEAHLCAESLFHSTWQISFFISLNGDPFASFQMTVASLAVEECSQKYLLSILLNSKWRWKFQQKLRAMHWLTVLQSPI